MRKLQVSDNVVYRTLQAQKISGIFRKNSGKFPTFYFSGKVTTLSSNHTVQSIGAANDK